MTHTKKTALCGVFTGLSIALMWIGSFVPSMDYALPAMAGMFVFLLVLELGPAWPTGVYLATSVLAALLLPNKSVALFYILFFGGYPVLRWLLECKLPKGLAWVCKFAVFNVSMISGYFLAVQLFGLELSDFGVFGQYAGLFMIVLGNATFVVYDAMVLASFQALYNKRWQKKLRHLLQ